MLEISKVYKIMGLLQPETDEAPKENNTSNLTVTQSQLPQQYVFPKLQWECLQHRLQNLDRIASTKNPQVINELSNVCSHLFDLQYKSINTLYNNKLPVSEANIKQLNFYGAKFLQYTQQMLKDFFPSKLKLVQDAVDSSTVPDPVSGQPILECLQENHIFQLYINLMFRVAQKSELMVVERH